MRLVVASALFLACAATFYAAGSFSYLASNVPAAHLLLTISCWIFFLLSLSFVVIVSTDARGGLASPKTLAELVFWALLAIQGGFALGRLVNYQSSLDIMVAASNSGGAEVFLTEDGAMALVGEIGFRTVDSLSEIYEESRSDVLSLESGGGLIDSAARMGSFLQDNEIATYVSASCASACVIVALSGKELVVTPDAQFGFHQGSAVASPGTQLGRFIASVATDDLLSRLRGLGVPEAVLDKAEITPADDMYYLSGAEMFQAGLAQHLVE